MSDPKPPGSEPPPAAPSTGPTATTGAGTTATATTGPIPEKAGPPPRNPALRMLGLPALPRKLPSRNWLIFWAVAVGLTAAITHDKRGKKRATARWARAVSHLAREPVSHATEQPRRLTVFLGCPPGDGLRVSQDHFLEYVKPVLAASGLDWEFVQGREEGDVRAAVAERIRRERRDVERPGDVEVKTEETLLAEHRERSGIKEYDGLKGDLIVGRHAWKEYVRGLHEGWLGPLDPPAKSDAEAPKSDAKDNKIVDRSGEAQTSEGEKKPESGSDGEDKKEPESEEKKPERPPQPPPYNSTADYSSAHPPAQMSQQFTPVVLIQEPHVLGFSKTFTRMNWFLNRRKLADDIGRQTAAICLGYAQEWSDSRSSSSMDTFATNPADDAHREVTSPVRALEHEESFWPKSVWKKSASDSDNEGASSPTPSQDDGKAPTDGAKKAAPKEKIWTVPIVTDPRVVDRLRRFEVRPEEEARAAAIAVPEDEIEGWIKGSLRSLGQWGAQQWKGKRWAPNVGDIDSDD